MTKILLSLFLSFLLVLYPSGFSYAQSLTDLNKQLQELLAKRTQLTNQILTSKKKAQEKKAEAEKITKDIKNIENSIVFTENKIKELGVQISDKETNIDQKTQEIVIKEDELNKEINKQYETIKMIYEIGSASSVINLLTVDSLSDAVDRTSYLSALESRLEKNIDDITKLKETLTKEKENLQKQRDELNDLKGQQQRFKFGLDKQKDTKKTLLSNVRVQQAEYEKLVEEAKRAYTDVNSDLYRITESARTKNKRTGDKKIGNLTFSWPASGTITASFGVPTPVQSYHTGLDIDGQIGDSILASADGTVSFTGGNSKYGYGLYVKIDHGEGVSTLYGHLSGFAVSEGDEIKRGELIGYMGNTGYAIAFGSGDGSHLHFEVREDEVPVNPIIYLP